MPRLIEPEDGGPIGIGDLCDALDASRFDVCDEDAFAAHGPLLARLGRNRAFLADLAIAELKDRCGGQARINSYGAQVLLLAPPNGRYLLRANIWPARHDPVTRASGTAAFFYDLPHDHNFNFLTYGYLGPGYWSDYYLFDRDRVAGVDGEPAHLRFVERARLEPGRLMLYRAHKDVHVQLPPDSLSVSLNILGYEDAQPWHEQFRFDVERNVIVGGLTVTPSEALMSLATQLGGGNGRDLAGDFAVHHPNPRMRLTAWSALASAESDPGERLQCWAAACADPHPQVARSAQDRVQRLAQTHPERS